MTLHRQKVWLADAFLNVTSVLYIGILEQHKTLRIAKSLIPNVQCDLHLKKVPRPLFDGWIKCSCNQYMYTCIIKAFSFCLHHVSCLARHMSLVLYYHCIICWCILKVVTIKTFKYLCVFNSVMTIIMPRVRKDLNGWNKDCLDERDELQ